MRLVVGEAIVDLHPAETGDAGSADAYARRAGGAPANVAVGLSRLGDAPLFRTRLGEDGFGDFLAATLADEGVPADLVERDPDAPTGLAVVGRDAGGDRSFSLYLDGTASVGLRPGSVDDATLAGVDWVHIGGVLLAFEPARSATIDLLERVPDGTSVSFDPNARPGLGRGFDYGATLERVLPLVDVVVASGEDVRPAGFAGDPPELARSLVAAGAHTAVLTRGAAGAYGFATDDAPWGGAEADHGGFPVDAVDTTGAGDAFTAGAVTALSEGRPFADALAYANAVAAASTTAEGAMTALPDREAVEGLLAGE
ncbi:carbohydrate kinase family protein [Halorarum salinum]|uniref:Carbohydrate kinase n=1 Tax=Halorarum salinum TaxID=2743089 RepID=A0A7D5QBB6_9EURY|nr:PfkB family carbohydrate kinase [Halobaculum salinum]QLG61680.1 carbohydrate kinase [Halobaculum salinum]